MRILYLADRLSARGGADQHLLQVIGAAAGWGASVKVAAGRIEREVEIAPEAEVVRLRGLAAATASTARLGGLDHLLAGCDVAHVQNVMNPAPLAAAVAIGRAVVTVQDHRVFCPGPGKTLPSGARCNLPMSDETCTECLPDAGYRSRRLELTRARRDALARARLVVLSAYMAGELAAVGLDGAQVVPPWVEPGPERRTPGDHLLLAGRLVRHKGVVDAWRAWRAAGVAMPLKVAGAGPLEDALAGAERLGWLSRQRLRQELGQARALLFPTLWQEPFGILGIEALAMGTPVIVVSCGGTSEWSDAGCLRVPPGDVAAMVDAIRRLVDAPDGALDLGREGRTMVAERFARQAIEPRLRALYAGVAG